MIRHHLLSEVANLFGLRFSQRGLCIVDIDLIRGDYDSDDLRICGSRLSLSWCIQCY